MRINEQIKSPQVRLLDNERKPVGVVDLAVALEAARRVSLDLVEISPNAEPPVCQIMDQGKYFFQKNKQRAQAKKKQKQIHIKVLMFRPTTEEADFQVKLRKAREFLDAGDKVKLVVRFRGREITHQEFGSQILTRLQAELQTLSTIEQLARLEGRQMVMVLSPVKRKK